MQKYQGYIKEPDPIQFALSGIQSRDCQRRKHNVELLREKVLTCAQVGQSELLKPYLPVILRLAYACPFKDVREKCLGLLEELKSKGEKIPRRVYPGPSSFIPSKEAIPLNLNEEDIQSLLVESFLASGRLTHVHWLMGYHPQYLECFLNTHFYLMGAEGPLPFDWRCYIAIMGASRHRCAYLIELYESEFLKQDGDQTWLKGLDYVPAKLYNLHNINKLLAHQPWTLTSDDMKELREGEDSWSLSELVQAITILVHFHCLSSFVFGCGVTPEIDLKGGHTFRPLSLNSADESSNCVANDVDELTHEDNKVFIELMKTVSKAHNDHAEVSAEISREEFESIARDEVCEYCEPEADPKAKSGFCHYLKSPNFRYEIFAERVDKSQFLNVNEYSWEEYGFSLVDRFYPEMGQLLDEKFRVCQQLTYHTVGTEDKVDTQTFRQATWNYIHVLYGLFHDDYRYDEVNKLMERSYKTYVKKVVCFPETTAQDDYLNFMRLLTHSEKVHINLIAFESRMQAELLYALRAVMR